MQRVVTVWCPEWPIVAAGVQVDHPVAVVRSGRVIARTNAAVESGVRVGDRRRAAQGACAELVLIDDDPDRDARRFESVVHAVAEIAPRIEIVEPGWLRLDARGPSRYFGGDTSLAERLCDTVAKVIDDDADGQVVVGIADGRSTSSLASRRAIGRRSGSLVVPSGRSAEFVAPLRVTMLRDLGEITPELADLFVRLGLVTLGDLAELTPHDVLARFGTTGIRAHDIARAVDERRVDATDPPPEWWVDHVFAEPIDRIETMIFVVKRLADDLTARLSGDGRVCVRLVVIIETEHGERNERVWYRAGGMSSLAMVERARWQLEGWMGEGGVMVSGMSAGVTLIRLVPDEVRGDDGEQIGLWGGRSRADHHAERAVVRLSGLAGDDGVRVPEWVGGRLPAERYRTVPAVSVDLADPRLDRDDGPWPGSLLPPSPTVVMPDPIPVEVFDEHGRPVRVSGRGEVSSAPSVLVSGTERLRVVAWAGPWPVEQRWWSTERSRRLARFQVVTEDGDAHLVVVERQMWSILASYS